MEIYIFLKNRHWKYINKYHNSSYSTKITLLSCQSNDATAAGSAEHAYETCFVANFMLNHVLSITLGVKQN